MKRLAEYFVTLLVAAVYGVATIVVVYGVVILLAGVLGGSG